MVLVSDLIEILDWCLEMRKGCTTSIPCSSTYIYADISEPVYICHIIKGKIVLDIASENINLWAI